MDHQEPGDHVLSGRKSDQKARAADTKPSVIDQATHINFICPMRFDAFPLDTQVRGRYLDQGDQRDHYHFQTCKFQVGSYSYDLTKMTFKQTNKVQG